VQGREEVSTGPSRKYRHLASSIESLLYLNTMSIKELSGRLLVVEENDKKDHYLGKNRGKGRDEKRSIGEKQ
jgi:hypothetical protein